MVKYYNYALTFAEVPDEISLCINITNCPYRCTGCHSPFLQEDIGMNLNCDLQQLINKHKDQFTCVCFLGEGNDKKELQKLINYVKNMGYKTCLYSGADDDILDNYENLDYYKKGSYQPNKGPLNNKNTNQHMYKKINNKWIDITYKFFPKELINESTCNK